jgi:putative transposase
MQLHCPCRGSGHESSRQSLSGHDVRRLASAESNPSGHMLLQMELTFCVALVRRAGGAHCSPPTARSSARPLPIGRQPAVAAPLAHHVPKAGEGKMVTADQRLVGSCAVEEGHARFCCQRHVLIESERPLRMLEADRGVDHGVVCSMSRSGNVWDNAAMESFFSSLKTERTGNKTYRTRDQAKADVFDYIERFYNSKRRHSTIGYLSPMEFERRAGLA